MRSISSFAKSLNSRSREVKDLPLFYAALAALYNHNQLSFNCAGNNAFDKKLLPRKENYEHREQR